MHRFEGAKAVGLMEVAAQRHPGATCWRSKWEGWGGARAHFIDAMRYVSDSRSAEAVGLSR